MINALTSSGRMCYLRRSRRNQNRNKFALANVMTRRIASIIAFQTIIAVVGGVALYRILGDRIERRNATLHVGDRLPPLAAVDISLHDETLVMAMRAGCEFVERSMPFYRRLAELRARGATRVAMVAVSPDSDDMLRTLLRIHAVDVPRAALVPLKSLKLTGTPMLLLVDRRRRVLRLWDGSLSPSGEADVLQAIGVTSRVSDSRSWSRALTYLKGE